MNLTLLLFTRTRQADYHFYLPLPEDASASVKDFVQTQLEQLQQLPTGEVHFFTDGTDAVLLRIIETGQTDLYARPIRSLEGFYCPASDIYVFWLELWRVVPAFFSAAPLANRLLNGEQPAACSAQDILDSLHAPRTSLYDKLLTANQPVSFVAQQKGVRFSTPIPPSSPKYWISHDTRNCTLQLNLHRKDKFARLCAYTVDAPAMLLCRSDRIPFDKNGLSLQQLRQHAKAIEKTLLESGWHIVGGDAT